MVDGLTNSPSSAYVPSARGWWATALALVIVAAPLLLMALRSDGLDFRAFYVAAKASAAHLDPYADNRRFGAEFADVENESGISRWIYPPPALFYAVPLGMSSYGHARILFEVASIAALGWVLFFLGRRFAIAPAWLILVGISLPAIACVQRGQIDLLILLCVVLACRLSNRWWAGLALGVAISIKIFPAALLLWWLLEKKFKQVATAIALTTVICLLALWRFGPSSYASFLHNLTTLHAHVFAGPFFSYSPGFVGSYNNPLILLDGAGIITGFVLTVVGIFYFRYKRAAPEVGYFATLLLSQLMNTTLWTMGMVMYFPVCLVAIGRIRSKLVAAFFLLPLYLPSQIRIFGITPRLMLALAFTVWLATHEDAPRTSIPATTSV